MTTLCLVGIDPGIVTTAVTSVALDFERREWRVDSQTWDNVTRKNGFVIEVDQDFLDQLAGYVQNSRHVWDLTLVGIEAFRPRGHKNDQRMLHLVQSLH